MSFEFPRRAPTAAEISYLHQRQSAQPDPLFSQMFSQQSQPSFASAKQQGPWNTQSFINTKCSAPPQQGEGRQFYPPPPDTLRYSQPPSGQYASTALTTGPPLGQNVSVHQVPRQSPWASQARKTYSVPPASIAQQQTTRQSQPAFQNTQTSAPPDTASVDVSVHNFGMTSKPASRRYDEKKVFWDANVPSTHEKTTSAYSDWLNERATEARITLEEKEEIVRKKRDREVKRQSEMTDKVFVDATKAARSLQNVVSQSGDEIAIYQFNDLVYSLRDLSAELNMERDIRNTVTNTQLEATDAAWQGWKVTKRAFDVASGNASLDDARSLWKAHDDERKASEKSHKDEGVWHSMMSNLEGTPTYDILEAFEEALTSNPTQPSFYPQPTAPSHNSLSPTPFPSQFRSNYPLHPIIGIPVQQQQYPQRSAATNHLTPSMSSSFYQQPRQQQPNSQGFASSIPPY
ncbi:hypothetical protein L198_01215 [Cryptococcus wingfieldii CBS 7118]|uniref:Uncharacterized protein n=1 Tax=Cryptococcus wingfieldii CBS 7118 TaxID=1295528 RepID=A0A1E3K3D5_9TREE|nr:hypothetical protein L198_01215 [Cryptococcus wingfieldii CBS 7118]ODO07634.1 hypothetical protein L198_01215 [Cryptococcus wingfieldii CBS 7118]